MQKKSSKPHSCEHKKNIEALFDVKTDKEMIELGKA